MSAQFSLAQSTSAIGCERLRVRRPLEDNVPRKILVSNYLFGVSEIRASLQLTVSMSLAKNRLRIRRTPVSLVLRFRLTISLIGGVTRERLESRVLLTVGPDVGDDDAKSRRISRDNED